MVAILAAVGLTSLAGLASFGIFVVATVWDSRNGNNKSTIMSGLNDKIEFFGSQLGGQQVINYSYTDEPWRLLAYDIYYFLAYWRNWIYILYPATPTDSGDLAELSPTRGNLMCIAVHVILVIAQLFFIFSLPFTFLFPLWMVAIWIVGFVTCNELVCGKFLNGEGTTYHSDPKYAPSLPEHAHEQWVFLNGVAVGSHWMRSNLNRLALTFKRPILGIHNRTHGILFDVIECLIQRNLTYATGDVRMCYSMLKEKLYDPSLTKVIFICHSQGGIEGGLVLDWLIQELPQDMLAKLEVYTFGCAANHFNNPHRHFLSQKMAHDGPAAVTATTTTTAQVKGGGTTTEDLTAAASLANSVPTVDGTGGTAVTESPTQFSRTAVTGSAPLASTNSQNPPPLDTELTHRAAAAVSTRSTMSAAADRAIGHIEHYAHTSDFVARWGVLHFTSSPNTTSTARYMGRVFARSSARGGHQFCLHYLDGMFPLVRDDKTGEFVGALEEGNKFMESEVALQADGEREGEEVSAGSAGGCMMGGSGASGGHRTGTWTSGVEVSGFGLSAGGVGTVEGKKKVKELSRLWGYVNGKSPEDVGATVAIGQRIDLWSFKAHV